jgi:NAD(P)-dependent dehydrogenase (short-subunit alcohol dehydrogenase family)
MNRIALITGASSGFGLLTSVTLAKRGWRVLATMRDLGRRERLEAAGSDAGVLERIEFHALDVRNAEQVVAVADMVGRRGKPLNALVNNAGVAVPGLAEEITDAELRDQFETNFFGAAAMTRALLPQMRRQGFGHVVMVSSISGRVGFPGVSSYVASKFALEGWSETLRSEMTAFGVKVVLVEPGSYQTDIWTRNAKLTAKMQDSGSPNAERVARWRDRVERNAKNRADPQQVADLIARILEIPEPRLRYVIGKDAKMALLMRSVLPVGVFERLIQKLSGLDQ